MGPGLRDRIVHLAAVGVDRNGKAGAALQAADQRLDKLRLRAVDADHFQMGMILGQRRSTFGNRLALAVVLAVPAGEADPVVGAQFFPDPGLQQRFVQGRLSLKEQNVRASLQKQLRPAGVERVKLLIADLIGTGVLRAVGEIGAVGSHAGKTKGPGTAGCAALLLPPLRAGFQKELHRTANQCFRLLLTVAAAHESRDGCLIAAGDAAVRPGTKVIHMHLLYHFRILGKGFRGPKLMIQIQAHLLKGRGHGPVNDQNTAGIQYVLLGCFHSGSLISPIDFLIISYFSLRVEYGSFFLISG